MPGIERCSVQPDGSLARAEHRAREARERALRAGNAGRPAVGARYVRAGLLELGWAEDDAQPDARLVPGAHHALTARLLIILAALEAEQGRAEYGLRLLDRAESLTAAQDRGVLLAQRGLLLRRAWRSGDALRMLSEAIALLEGNAGETANLVAALMNRGFLHLNAGDVRRARADLGRCQRVAVAEGMHQIVAKTVHNLGYCDLLAGDIPAALQLFNAASDSYRLSAAGNLPVLAMDKARALLAVGLAQDAASELDGAIASFRRQRLDQDLAEAELARAQAALAAGQPEVARRWAAAAQRRFRRQGNDACSSLAELIQLRARSVAPSQPARIATEALLLARKLRGCGLGNDADTAELIAARGLLAAGRNAEAKQRIAAVRRGASLEVSLLRRLARAELAEREGRPGAGLAELRAGLATVQARRGRLGSIDLQTGAAALGADLAAAGLRQALDRRSAPLVFAWLERSRAQAFLARPVRPPADPRAAEILAELRQLGYLIRTAELSGVRDPAAITRRAGLQREIRERSWQATGHGEGTGRASLAEIGAAVDASGQSLVGILARAGRMHAVVLRHGAVHLVGLGDFEVAAEAARRLNADLDTLAGRRLPGRLEAVIRESIRRQTDVLTAEIVAPLRSLLGADGVVLVPAGALASIPWSMLPDLRGRPVTVCPSASSWLAAWRAARAGPRRAQQHGEQHGTGQGEQHGEQRGAGQGEQLAAPALRSGPPLLVAGPDLAHANFEVTEIAKIYPGCQPLLAESATVNATLLGLDGAPLAHLAAHGHHDRENFLFSSLDLADGPLMAYDIQQLAAAPGQVVLSACDVGRTVVRPGEEILGFTAALLYVGTATVIASVARVADEAAVDLMTGYHRALAAGARPARALADAVGTEPFSPFVCFGSG
jgi:tetratricopeptide (TPR) repeat protein